MRLLPLEIWIQAPAGSPLAAIRHALGAAALSQGGPEARPLRWAVTAVDAARGLRIEAVLVVPSAAPVPSPPP